MGALVDSGIDIQNPNQDVQIHEYDNWEDIWQVEVNDQIAFIWGKCPNCGNSTEILDEPDPFSYEINGDETEVVQCIDCYNESIMDI